MISATSILLPTEFLWVQYPINDWQMKVFSLLCFVANKHLFNLIFHYRTFFPYIHSLKHHINQIKINLSEYYLM